jgi:hypothetical protein
VLVLLVPAAAGGGEQPGLGRAPLPTQPRRTRVARAARRIGQAGGGCGGLGRLGAQRAARAQRDALPARRAHQFQLRPGIGEALIGVERAESQLTLLVAQLVALPRDVRPHFGRGSRRTGVGAQLARGQPAIGVVVRLVGRRVARARHALATAEVLDTRGGLEVVARRIASAKQRGGRIEARIGTRRELIVVRLERRAVVVLIEEVAVAPLPAAVREQRPRAVLGPETRLGLAGAERSARHAQLAQARRRA